jgi:hypothetical protein
MKFIQTSTLFCTLLLSTLLSHRVYGDAEGFDEDGDNLIVVNKNDGIARGNFVQPFLNVEGNEVNLDGIDNSFDDGFYGRRGRFFGFPHRRHRFYDGYRFGRRHRYWGRDVQTTEEDQKMSQATQNPMATEGQMDAGQVETGTGPLAIEEAEEDEQWYPYHRFRRYPYYPYYQPYWHRRYW